MMSVFRAAHKTVRRYLRYNYYETTDTPVRRL